MRNCTQRAGRLLQSEKWEMGTESIGGSGTQGEDVRGDRPRQRYVTCAHAVYEYSKSRSSIIIDGLLIPTFFNSGGPHNPLMICQDCHVFRASVCQVKDTRVLDQNSFTNALRPQRMLVVPILPDPWS